MEGLPRRAYILSGEMGTVGEPRVVTQGELPDPAGFLLLPGDGEAGPDLPPAILDDQGLVEMPEHQTLGLGLGDRSTSCIQVFVEGDGDGVQPVEGSRAQDAVFGLDPGEVGFGPGSRPAIDARSPGRWASRTVDWAWR